MTDKELEKDSESLYTNIGDISLAEKVRYITRWSVAIFIVAALVIVASIVLFFVLPDMLLVPTLVLVAGVIIAVVAGLLRSVRGGKYERQFKSASSLNLGKDSYGNYETSSEEKYTSALSSGKRDQKLYEAFSPIEFVIVAHAHAKSITTLSHEYKRNGFSYCFILDDESTHTITINPMNNVEECVGDYIDTLVNKEIVESETKR